MLKAEDSSTECDRFFGVHGVGGQEGFLGPGISQGSEF